MFNNATKYRKKPVVIEAIQWDGRLETLEEIQRAFDQPTSYLEDGSLKIYTLEGNMTAQVDDYIIKEVQGEIYPCKPDIFQDTYERVGGDES